MSDMDDFQNDDTVSDQSNLQRYLVTMLSGMALYGAIKSASIVFYLEPVMSEFMCVSLALITHFFHKCPPFEERNFKLPYACHYNPRFCIFFTPFFTAVYKVERLVLQTVYALKRGNSSILRSKIRGL